MDKFDAEISDMLARDEIPIKTGGSVCFYGKLMKCSYNDLRHQELLSVDYSQIRKRSPPDHPPGPG